MTNTVALRSGKDRLRYSLAFEAILMIVLIPAGALFFNESLADIGLLGLILSVKAMLVSLLFNWVMDHIDARRGVCASQRTAVGRIIHALGFELSLLTTSLPLYIWWLEITVWEALVADLVVTSFVVVYTYAFTLGYDRMFPIKPRPSFCNGMNQTASPLIRT